MSISGPKVLEALDEALRDIRREEDDILRRLSRSAERLAKIHETETELLQQLAQQRIGPAGDNRFAADLAEAHQSLRAALDVCSGEIAAGARRLKALDGEITEEVSARAAALAEIDSQQAALRRLASRIAAAVARDHESDRQPLNAVRLKAIATAARAKARQAESEREQKTRPFLEDPLFSYLLRQGYGTSAYRARGIVARLDAAVAKLADFERAHADYLSLSEWPARLQAHAERQAAEAAAAEAAIDEIERTAIDAAGGGAIREALDEAQARLVAIDGRLVDIQDKRDAAAAAQMALTELDSRAFDGAVEGLAKALGSPDLQALIGTLRQAEAAAIDPLVEQIDDAQLRVTEERTGARDQRARLKTLAARRRSLEDIEYEFKAQKFDDPRSLFRDAELVGGTLDGFLTGTIDAPTYWAAFGRAQTWNDGTSEWGRRHRPAAPRPTTRRSGAPRGGRV